MLFQLQLCVSSHFFNLISWLNPRLGGISESVNQPALNRGGLAVAAGASSPFWFLSEKEADESLQIRIGALRLKLHVNKWICSPSRQPLIVFHRDEMQFVSFLRRTSKGSGPSAMTHCTEKCSVSNRRKSDLDSVSSFLFTSPFVW